MIQRRNYLKRTPLRRVSKKRSRENAQYAKQRKAYFAEPRVCAVMKDKTGEALRATEIHHIEGRIGAKLLDESHWLPVSRWGHEWIHSHPKEAREKGWLRTPSTAALMKERAAR